MLLIATETTLTLGLGAIIAAVGAVGGAVLGFGIVRGKLSEVERLQKALFRKFDDMAEKVGGVQQQMARHDERLKSNQSDIHQIRARLPTGPIDIDVR